MKTQLILALGLLACNAAQGAVTLAFSDTVGAPNSVTIYPGESFDVLHTLTSDADSTQGISFFLEALGASSGQFRITGRNITGTAFGDLTTSDGIALAPPSALIDPTNGNDLGGQVDLLPNGIGNFLVATFTIQSLPGIGEGNHNIGTNLAFAISGTMFDEIAVNQPTYGITVVPEPGSALLLGLGAVGVMLRRKR